MTSAYYITAGDLNKLAYLQSRTETPDGYGGVDVVWANERRIWCAIIEQTGNESQQAMREQTTVRTEIRARYSDDITSDKRIVYGSKVYNIRAVTLPKECKEFVRIFADRGVAT